MLAAILLSSILFQSPVQGPVVDSVKLSDGRVVPFGQGTICQDECPDTLAPSSGINYPLISLGISGIILARGITNRASSSRDFIPPPNGSSSMPAADVPEVNTLLSLGSGLGALSLLFRRKFRK